MGSDPKRKGGYNDQYAAWQAQAAPTATAKPLTAAQAAAPKPVADINGVAQATPIFTPTGAGPGIPALKAPPPTPQPDLRTMLANIALRASAPGHFGGTHPGRRTGSGRDRGDYSGSGGRGGNYR